MDKMVELMSTSQQLYFYSPEGLRLVKYPGTKTSTLLRAAGQALAQYDEGQVAFYATDMQGSVLRFLRRDVSCSVQYTVYGHDDKLCASVLRFNGQRKEALSTHYILGDGYRAFSSFLMRFNAPDSFSPFGAGGINPYCYCGGNPVDRIDPTGHVGEAVVKNTPRGDRSPTISPPRPSEQKPGSHLRPTLKSAKIREFAEGISNVQGDKFADLLAYQGRGTGAWIDEFNTRTKFVKGDLPVVEGAQSSTHRDVVFLYNDLVKYPAQSKADSRSIAAYKLLEAFERIGSLRERMAASVARDKVRRDWLEPPQNK
ncbi:hypothetical protein CR511_13120 [Pseudomonas putida]|jgi:RHS repeat-associated protein|nr:hypothetical protein CR511_13120 [Pseudomonas putida]